MTKKRYGGILWIISFAVILAGSAHAGNTLETIRKKGILVAGVKVTTPPFGYVNKEGEIVGYDVDIARIIAEKLGVRLKLRPVTSEDRIPELLQENIDIIASTMARTPDREKFVEFCHTNVLAGQKFLVKKGTVANLKDLEGKAVGAERGSNSELNAKEALPGVKIVSFDDYDAAIAALRNGEIAAITAEGGILLDLMGRLPDNAFEVPEIQVTHDQYGLGIRKNDSDLLEFVGKTMTEMEHNGEAKKLYERWFPENRKGRKSAFGVIVRSTAVGTRFLVTGFKGVFDPDAELGVFDSEGRLVGKGFAKGVYAEQLYVEVEKDSARSVRAGFLVGMSTSSDEVAGVLKQNREILSSIRDDAKKEEEARIRETKATTEEEQKRRDASRLQYQQLQQRRMELEYERDRYYYNNGYRYWRR